MKIIPQDSFIEITTDLWNSYNDSHQDAKAYQIEQVEKTANNLQPLMNRFLLEVIANDLGYILYKEDDGDTYKSMNEGLMGGLVYLLLLILNAEYGAVGVDRKGFFRPKLLGFSKNYLPISQLEKSWKSAFKEENYIYKTIMEELNKYYA